MGDVGFSKGFLGSDLGSAGFRKSLSWGSGDGMYMGDFGNGDGMYIGDDGSGWPGGPTGAEDVGSGEAKGSGDPGACANGGDAANGGEAICGDPGGEPGRGDVTGADPESICMLACTSVAVAIQGSEPSSSAPDC